MKMKVKGLIKGPFFWMLPLFLVLLIMFIYPTFEVIRYSFTDMSLLKEDYQYTFRSYLSVFRDKAFLNILKVTFIFVFFSVVFQTLLGFVIALAVDKGEALGMRGTVVVRVVSLLSWCIPGVIIGVIWKILLDETDTGILTSLLIRLGIGRVPFLTSAGSALVCAIIANIWRGTAQSMILSYSGLKTISKDILEAASIDGASAWQRLIHVIIPSVASVISINVVLNIELDESAFIDGCGRIKTLIKIVAPLIVPGVVSVVILVFVRTWSQFIVPYILLNDQEMFPISVALVNLQSTSDAITTHYLAAAGVIAILPTLLVFILLQKFIVSAMTAGAVKG